RKGTGSRGRAGRMATDRTRRARRGTRPARTDQGEGQAHPGRAAPGRSGRPRRQLDRHLHPPPTGNRRVIGLATCTLLIAAPAWIAGHWVHQHLEGPPHTKWRAFLTPRNNDSKEAE